MLISNWLHYLRCYAKKLQTSGRGIIHPGVVVSLTTTPVRINKIWPTLNSILLQSELPEKIYLWIPKQFKRFPNQSIDQLPEFIKNNPFIQVQFIDKDYGPATKLLPCLEQIQDKNTKIIVIDDDRLYPRHLIRDLLRYEKLDSTAAIGIAGTVVHGAERREYVSSKKLAMVDVLLGYQGYLVKPKFFSKAVFDYPEHLPEAFFEDDVWFSGHLQRNAIRRLLIPIKSGTQSIITQNTKTIGLCMNENRDKRNFMSVFTYFQQEISDEQT